MKKTFVLLFIFTLVGLFSIRSIAQEPTAPAATTTTAVTENTDQATTQGNTDAQAEDVPIHQQLKKQFIDGGPKFMAAVLIVLILGLAFALERIIYLGLSTTNTKSFLRKVEKALDEGGIEAAKEVCRKTRGPVASIFYQGLERYSQGLDSVEKAVISYGGVQTGQLETNLSWISLFIALAPMLGFLGTVIGMVDAFDAIAKAGDISPNIVAGGIKVALITTIGGLIVAIILQLFYNYLLSKIDSITNKMEDASISLMDILVKYELVSNKK